MALTVNYGTGRADGGLDAFEINGKRRADIRRARAKRKAARNVRERHRLVKMSCNVAPT